MTAEEWSGFRKNPAALFAVEAYRECWEQEAEFYSEAFPEQIESIIPESSGVQTRLRFAGRFDRGSSQEAS